MNFWAEAKRLSYVMDDSRFREILEVFGYPVTPNFTGDDFRDAYRHNFCDSDGWPTSLPVVGGRQVQEGIKVFSVSGKIEGRTTGVRMRCPSSGCKGWFVEVQWETGQKFRPCSEGWHFDSQAFGGKGRIDIIGGGEISARFISKAPLGTHPLDKSEWPKKSELLELKGWRAKG